MSRVLVTGGAGFLGRHLVARLAERGDEVAVLDDLSTGRREVPAPAELIVGSVVEPPELPGPFDLVFHLASPASPPRYLADPVGTLRTAAEGTRTMLDLAARWRARLVFASTSEVYGDPERHPQDEGYRGAVDVTGPRACYDEGKRYAEALLYAYRRTGRLEDSAVGRVFNSYGPGMDLDDGRLVPNLVAQALRGEPLTIHGDGTQTRSLCYVDDTVEGLLRLAGGASTGPINLGSTDERTVLEIAAIVEAEVGGTTGRRHLPRPDGDPQRRCPDVTRARRELGWAPTVPLEEGIARTVEDFRSRA